PLVHDDPLRRYATGVESLSDLHCGCRIVDQEMHDFVLVQSSYHTEKNGLYLGELIRPGDRVMGPRQPGSSVRLPLRRHTVTQGGRGIKGHDRGTWRSEDRTHQYADHAKTASADASWRWRSNHRWRGESLRYH